MDGTTMAKMQHSKMESFDLDQFLPYLLNQAAEVTSQNFQHVYKAEYGMTRTQWRVMANLGKRGAMTASEICRITFVEKTKMSRAVLQLEDKGFLQRNTLAGDRRAEQLSLTSKGRTAFRSLGQKAAAFDFSLRQHLGVNVADSLEKVLRTLIQNAADV
jgi:DNA-binding MarR family transcriptional regulator